MTVPTPASLYTCGFGNRPENVEIPQFEQRDPTPQDVKYPLGKRWINKTLSSEFSLVSFSSFGGALVANWLSLGAGVGGVLNTVNNVAPFLNNIDIVANQLALVPQGIVVTTPSSQGPASSIGISALVDGTSIVFDGAGQLSATAGAGPAVHTLSVEGGAPILPLAGNFDFAGVAGASALLFSSPGAGLVEAAVQVDGVTVTINGLNQLVAAGGGAGLTWSVIAVNTAGVVNNGYITNSAGNVDVSLPAVSVVGDILRIARNIGGGSWSISQGVGQLILAGNTNTTAGVAGSLSSTNLGDAVELVCVAANLQWGMISSVGNLTAI